MLLTQTSSEGALTGNAASENWGVQAGRPSQERPFRVPDCGVSRAVAEVRSNSGGGGEAATPTSGVEGPNQAPRNRSEAEVPRVQWSFLGGLR